MINNNAVSERQYYQPQKKRRMKRTILYYPTIDVPNGTWLRNALLYWDEVSSIVPRSRDEELSREIRYLIDEKQFSPIEPDELMRAENKPMLENFQQEFKKIIASKYFKNIIKKDEQIIRLLQENKIDNVFRIDRNKTSGAIYDFLHDRKLANMDGGYDFINFEPNAGLLYMSLLAKYLADIDCNHTTIGTDYFVYEKFNFARVSKSKGFPVVSFDLKNVLPTPTEDVPFEDIICFKRKRADNLREFQQRMSEFQTKISKAGSNAEMKEIAIGFEDSLSKGVSDLTAVLKGHKIKFWRKTLKSLIILNTPITALVNIVDNPLIIPIALLDTTINVAIEFIDLRNKNKTVKNSPFSYVFDAREQRIIG